MRPQSLNHFACYTWDSARTARFYTEVLGMTLRGHSGGLDVKLPNGGQFIHTFFELDDGSHIAFFELAGQKRELPAPTSLPVWTRHIALNVESEEVFEQWQQRLRQHGVEFNGPINHDGVWKSIYFYDPNGIHLELTWQSRPLNDGDAASATAALEAWVREYPPVEALPDTNRKPW
jgi:catechol 2,3-dioxygenase-like lactoylglutathione lyase family enzyme